MFELNKIEGTKLENLGKIETAFFYGAFEGTQDLGSTGEVRAES